MENQRTIQEIDYCQQVAQTIMSQMKASAGMPVIWSWGAEKFGYTFHKDMPALMFKVSGLLHKGWVVVALNEWTDTYEVYLLNSRKNEVKMVDDVYCEDLGSVIDNLVERHATSSDDEYRKLMEEKGAFVL